MYQNPVISDVDAADPSVLAANGEFLAFTSSRVAGTPIGAAGLVPVYRSPDGVRDWRPLGEVVAPDDLPAWVDRSAVPVVQGPSVLAKVAPGTGPPASRLRYLLYFSAVDAASQQRCVGVMSSSHPTGRLGGEPFADASPSGEPLVCEATDPSVFVPLAWGDTGNSNEPLQEWLLYAAPRPEAPDQIRALPLDEAGLPAGEPTVLLTAELTWERGVVSGPSMLPDPDSSDRLLLLFAGGPRDADRHGVSWAICFEQEGTLDCPSRGQGDPWMGHLQTSTSEVEPVRAPGAPTPFRDTEGNVWVAYDAVQEGACASASVADLCQGPRAIHIDKMCIRLGTPRTNGPTATAESIERHQDCRADIALDHPQGAAWPEADVLFRSQEQWRGADGALSVVLDEEQQRVLWYFGDSFVDLEAPYERRGSFFVNNTVAVSTGFDPETADMEFFWTMADGEPQPIFKPAAFPDTLYWPSGGTVLDGAIDDGSRSILVTALPEVDKADLSLRGTTWGIVENYLDPPNQWNIAYVPQPSVAEAFGLGEPGRDDPVFMGIEREGSYLYAFAFHRPAALSNGPAWQVRWRINDVLRAEFTRSEWRDGDQWRGIEEFNGSPPQQAFATNAPQWSVHQERTAQGGYTKIDQAAFLGPMRWDNAASRDGPWRDEPPAVFDAPERYWEGILVYANWAAPAITGSADLVAMYSQNGGTEPWQAFWDESYYYPRFVKILYE